MSFKSIINAWVVPEILGKSHSHRIKMHTFIGYANDRQVRYNATSGGIGTALVKYLFDKGKIQTAVSLRSASLRYTPELIYNYSDYKITGSVYHDINLYQFIKEHITDIHGSLCCFALPCQVRPIRKILELHGITAFIIGLTCSSQLHFDATEYLLQRLHIDEEMVEKIQYRGKGWPSGITILLRDGSAEFVPNNNSLWSNIFHSRLFIPTRCFNCQETISEKSDVCLADPWLTHYINNERVGQSLVVCNSEIGKVVVLSAERDNYISLFDIGYDELLLSQKSTIDRKKGYKKHRAIRSVLSRVCTSSTYHKLVLSTSINFAVHCRLMQIIERIIQ